MPDSGESIERMELRFRAEPSAVRSTLPGGWLVWCLVGCAIGIGCWVAGRRQLSKSLREQLAKAPSTAEALIALEGLAALSPEASLDVVAGLENPDPVIARLAFRRLEGLVALWQSQGGAPALARYTELAKRLEQFSPQAPVENHRLASTLASRLYGLCYADGNPAAASTLELCQRITDRYTGMSTEWEQLKSSVERTAAQVQQATNPLAGWPATAPINRPADRLLETSTAPRDSYRLSDDTPATPTSENSQGASTATGASAGNAAADISSPSQKATFSLTVGRTQPRTGLATQSSSGATDPIPPTVDSDDRRQATLREPVMVAIPASLSSTPLVRMKLVTQDPDLNGIQHRPIEELVRLLASSDTRVAQGAAMALRAKGMDDQKIALASQLAAGSAAQRLALVQQIATDSSLLPEPWLLWMAEDGQPEVRRMSISLLSSMLSPEVERTLRILLAREQDPQVADIIRQCLVAGRAQR